MRSLQVGSVVLGHVRRIQLGENLDLLLNVLDFIFSTFEVDDLNGDRLLGAFIVAELRITREPES